MASFPKLGLYSGFGFAFVGPDLVLGYPFLDKNGVLQQDVVDQHAHWDTVVLEVQSCILRPGVVDALRGANPDIRIIGFWNLESTFYNAAHSLNDSKDVVGNLSRTLLGMPNGYIRSRLYGDHFNPLHPDNRPTTDASFSDVNLANEEVVRTMAYYIINAAWRTGGNGRLLFDGLFFDWAAHVQDDGVDLVDYASAGFATLADFKTAYTNGHRHLFDLLRGQYGVPAGFTIAINDGGFTDSYENLTLNGVMREGFPNESGGTWDKNMLANGAYPGVFTNDLQMRQPPQNWLNMLTGSSIIANELQKGRFGLGSACLSEAFFTCSSTNGRTPQDDRWKMFFPAYSVDRETGDSLAQADLATFATGKGWLGEPLGVAEQHGATWLRIFEHGAVVVNPSAQPATVSLHGYNRVRSGIAGDTVDIGGAFGYNTVVAPSDAVFAVRPPHLTPHWFGGLHR